jgi:citrate synthase
MAPDDPQGPGMYDPGLAYTTVAQTNLSHLDPGGELLVGGYPIEELAVNATYEESVFLLLNGRLPTEDELATFTRRLADRREIPETVRDLLAAAASEGLAPMTALRMGLAAADLGEDSDAPRETAERVVAVVPTLVATYWRFREDKDPLAPDPELGHVANYLWLLTGERPRTATVDALETVCVTLVEHGLDASSFAARTTVSTESDLVSAATAAVGALGGDRHAGRFTEAHEILTAALSGEAVDSELRDRASDGAVPGFGHPIYRARDPRAAVLSAALDRYDEQQGAAVSEAVERLEAVASEIIGGDDPGADESGAGDSGDGRTQQPDASVEFPATALLEAVGIAPALFAPTFAVARVGGWVAHALEGLREETLVRPSAQYVGEPKAAWTPVENRHTAGDRIIARPPQSPSLEPVSETLDVLSEPNRLEILLALYDSSAPVAYSALHEATSIADKGRFNYHLRTLRGSFVVQSEAGYALTEAGERLVDAVVANERLLGEEIS